MKLSLVIPCRDVNDPKLKDLLRSIDEQDFPKDQMETLIITEGTSESAKAIGIRKAKGEVIGILASDNILMSTFTLANLCSIGLEFPCYPARYFYDEKDDILNRYFALIGGNDPLSFYMRKNDRVPYWQRLDCDGIDGAGKTIGDNGFFAKKQLFLKTDLDNYYHIDNANELEGRPSGLYGWAIKHRTGGNIFKFFAKRYRYGLQHAFNKNRRWHLVDFRKKEDIWRLLLFGFGSLTIIHPLCTSIRGYLKVKDMAWFIHPLACLLTVFTYALLVLHLFSRHLMSRLSSVLMVVQRA